MEQITSEQIIEIYKEIVSSIKEVLSQLPDELTQEQKEYVLKLLSDSINSSMVEDNITVSMQKSVGMNIDAICEAIDSSVEIIKTVLICLKNDESIKDSEDKKELVDMIYALIENFYFEMKKDYIKNVPTIYFQLIHENAKLPAYAHPSDAGADIYCPETVIVPANARGFLIKTGLIPEIRPGWMISIRPRSGMSMKTPIRLSNCVGTIDSDYRNEIGVIVDNLSDEPYEIKAGDRIAQMLLEKTYHGIFEEVKEVGAIYTGDRNGGFGSTKGFSPVN